jgi:restriction system protein
MPIPDYQTLMLPLLKIAGDGKVHTKRDAVNELAVQFNVSEEERKELLPSGKHTGGKNDTFANIQCLDFLAVDCPYASIGCDNHSGRQKPDHLKA